MRTLPVCLTLFCVAAASGQRPQFDPVRPHAVDGLALRGINSEFQTDFESYALGTIDGQQNWIGLDPPNFQVVASPAVGTRAVRSLGGNQLVNLAVQTFGLGNAGSATIEWDWYFDSSTGAGDGGDQQIILQPNINTQNTVAIRIARDWLTQHLRVFTSISATNGIWIDLGFDIPHDQWVNFQLELAADRTYDLYIDDVYIRSAIAFTNQIEEFVVYNDGFSGNEMLVDNISITGDPACASDLDNDGSVGLGDLAIVLAAFNASPAGDINGDGVTDLSDLAEVLADFGEGCP